jgi:RNA polymerase sigma factor (sigma-70 family)
MQDEQNGLDLWQRFQIGDTAALEQLMVQNFTLLFRYGTKFSSDYNFIKDCVQDLFLDLWSRREHLSEAVAVKAYLMASLRRRLHRGMISQKWLADNAVNIDTLHFEIEFSIEESLILEESTQELASEIKVCLEQLPKRQKEVVYLKFYENLSREEIAEVMGVNPQSVSNLLQAAYKYLKANWKAEHYMLFLACFLV